MAAKFGGKIKEKFWRENGSKARAVNSSKIWWENESKILHKNGSIIWRENESKILTGKWQQILAGKMAPK
jgi:hypothetical protein